MCYSHAACEVHSEQRILHAIVFTMCAPLELYISNPIVFDIINMESTSYTTHNTHTHEDDLHLYANK